MTPPTDTATPPLPPCVALRLLDTWTPDREKPGTTTLYEGWHPDQEVVLLDPGDLLHMEPGHPSRDELVIVESAGFLGGEGPLRPTFTATFTRPHEEGCLMIAFARESPALNLRHVRMLEPIAPDFAVSGEMVVPYENADTDAPEVVLAAGDVLHMEPDGDPRASELVTVTAAEGSGLSRTFTATYTKPHQYRRTALVVGGEG